MILPPIRFDEDNGEYSVQTSHESHSEVDSKVKRWLETHRISTIQNNTGYIWHQLPVDQMAAFIVWFALKFVQVDG